MHPYKFSPRSAARSRLIRFSTLAFVMCSITATAQQPSQTAGTQAQGQTQPPTSKAGGGRAPGPFEFNGGRCKPDLRLT